MNGECGWFRCAFPRYGRRRDQVKTLAPFAVVAVVLQGCSYSYTDANGDRHAIGLLDVTVHAPAAPETFAGDVVDVTTIGLSVGRNAQGGYVTAGYNREVSAALRDNAMIIGNPVSLSRQDTQEQGGAK